MSLAHAPSRRMIVDFLTKTKFGHSIMRERSFLMGHIHLRPEHLANLTRHAPLSTLSVFNPASSDTLSVTDISSVSVIDSLFSPALESKNLDDVMNVPVPVAHYSSIDFSLDSADLSVP